MNTLNKKIVIIGTKRYHVNVNDFYMFFNRSDHSLLKYYYHTTTINKKWWGKENDVDNARLKIIDKINMGISEKWDNIHKLIEKIKKVNPDFICIGNGTDEYGQLITKEFGDKVLYSEYGWLHWNEHFYISKKGCSIKSDIADMGEEDLKKIQLRLDEIDNLKEFYKTNKSFSWKNKYIYIPMQVDKNDFKFTLCEFKDNFDFLKRINEIIPNNYDIIIRQHPNSKIRINVNKISKRFIDLSDKPINKFDLYSNMSAIVGINSTSLIESMLFKKPIFSYGEDLYCNKNLTYHKIYEQEQFIKYINEDKKFDLYDNFLSLLLERQINRKKCISNDMEYIKNHYWNLNL